MPAAAAQARSKYLAQGFLLFVGVVFLVGTFLILRWSSYALEQQGRFWDSQLSQGAYNAAAHAEGQISGRQRPWLRLAQSDAIKLYVTQALVGEGDAADASRTYLENALRLTLEREGLTQNPVSAVPVNGAVPAATEAGLALVGANGETLLSLGGARRVTASARPATPSTDPARLYGPYLDDSRGKSWVSLIVPIEGVQSSQIMAELHITYPLDMFTLLPRRNVLLGSPSIETVLLFPEAELVLQRQGDATALKRLPAMGGDERYLWAGARAKGTAGATAADGSDMLVAAQRVGESQWIAVQSISKNEALSNVRRQTWIWLLGSILALGLSCGLILLAWRRGVAHRAAAIAAARDDAGKALSDANDLLTTLADSQPSAVMVMTGDDVIAFANQSAATMLGRHGEGDLIGLPLAQCLSGADAQPILRAIDSARAIGKEITAAAEIEAGGSVRHGRVTAVPLAGYEDGGTVMIAFDDITQLVELRARREAALRQLVAVLTGLIDARDPYSASHSRTVARLSRHVATAMNYNTDKQRDVEMAALLSNAGKILVPRVLLTKPETLSQDELATVRAAIQKTATLLSSVEFDGQVRSILEALDSETHGVGEEAEAAAIIAAANALVGMVSPRAHRDAIELDDALEALEEVITNKQVLAAVDHCVRNQAALTKAQT